MDFVFERRINYYETDKMGIVHHSNYIRFLEEARCFFLDKIGLPYSLLEENGIMIPVLNVNVAYKHHVTFDDVLLIKVFVKEFNGIKMVVSYDVTDKKTGNTVIIAETKHCFTNTNLRPINLKKHFPDFYKRIENSRNN